VKLSYVFEYEIEETQRK